jgi:hypothetical protein
MPQGDALLAAARAAGVEVVERRLSLEALLGLLAPGVGVIVLVDVRKLRGGDGGYFGHFMPLVGYTRGCVLLHDCAREAPRPRLRVPRATFDAARVAEGTDEDVVIVTRRH